MRNENKKKEFSLSLKTAPAIAEAMGVDSFSVNREIESILIFIDKIKTLSDYAYNDLMDNNENYQGRVLNALSMISETVDKLTQTLEG